MSFQKNPTTTVGDLIYCDQTRTGAPGRYARLAPNSAATQKILTEASSTPTWTDPTTLAYNGQYIDGGTAAPGSGKFGEYVANNLPIGSAKTLTSAATVEITNITLPGDGIYRFGYFIVMSRGTSVFANILWYVEVNAASNSNSTLGSFYNASQLYGTYNLTPNTMTFHAASIFARLSGTTLTFLNGAGAYTLTSSKVYLNVTAPSISSGSGTTAWGSLYAVRIA